MCVMTMTIRLDLAPERRKKTAASAMKWCEQQGGHPDSQDHVSRIARLGASGKFPGSVERDMHTFLKGLNQRLGAKISTIRARRGCQTNVSLWRGAM